MNADEVLLRRKPKTWQVSRAARRFGGAAALWPRRAWLSPPRPRSAHRTSIYSPSSIGSTFVVIGEADDDLISISVDGNTISIADTRDRRDNNGRPGLRQRRACSPSRVRSILADPAPPAGPTAPVFGAGFDLQAAQRHALELGAQFFLEVSPVPGTMSSTAVPTTTRSSAARATTRSSVATATTASTAEPPARPRPAAPDLIDGQGGNDFAQYPRTSPVIVNLNDLPDDGFPGEGDNVITEQVFGGTKDDIAHRRCPGERACSARRATTSSPASKATTCSTGTAASTP